MVRLGRSLAMFFLTSLLGSLTGCFGVTTNPSYFPYLLPNGDVIRNHAKPIGPGYYENFDPHAKSLAVETTTTPSQVGSQVVILATVRDEHQVPRRGRRVDWKVTNGNIIEVDESGYFPARGGEFGNYGFSHTAFKEHRLSRGNANKLDDVMVRPGQSWLVVSSPVEGDTHVQVVVPAIHDWANRMKTVVIRWVDANWEFPPPARAKFGAEHEFVTRIARHTDRAPLAKYRVRYKILDGPPAMFLPSRTTEETVVTDLNGLGKVRIAQMKPDSGINRISVEIIRPPDPTTPTGSGVTIVTGETSIEWMAPSVKLSHLGPASAGVDQNVTFTTSAKNEGRLDSDWVEFTLPIPDGMEFVSSNPPAEPRGGQVVFTFPSLPVGQSHVAQTTFKARRAGAIRSVALMRTGDGQTDQQEVNTLITTPQLKVDLLGPAGGIIDVPINFTVRISNPGTGDLDDIQLFAEFDPGLEHPAVTNPLADKKLNKIALDIKGLKGGDIRDVPLTLVPRRAGALSVTVKVSSGALRDQATKIVNVEAPKVSLRVDGPVKRYAGRPAVWSIVVKNEGAAEQTGVMVRDRLPPELRFSGATGGGEHVAGLVTWKLGTLRPGQEVSLELTTDCVAPIASTEKVTSLSADGGVKAEKSRTIEIEGIAALRMELRDEVDPVEVGKNAVYLMTLTNTGSAPAKRIDIKAIVPNLLKAVSATGPTKETVAGQNITFERIDVLQPGSKVQLRIVCQALKEGKVYFRVEYTSELNERPLVEEEPTTIVATFRDPVIPAPPGGGLPMPVPGK